MKQELIFGDCIQQMKEIPSKSMDMIFTDPPYGLNYNQNDLASQRENIFGGKKENMKPNGIDGDGEAESLELFQNFLIEAKRILKNGACCCCCCGGGGGPKPLFAKWSLLMDDIIGFKQAVVWDKPGLGMGMHFRRNYEFVLIAQNGSPAHRWNGGNDTPNIVRIRKIIPREDQHPTEKPVELAGFFIKLFSNPGDVILDPFVGAGSTLIAAQTLKRNYIGFEISEKHFNSAKSKLGALETQTVLF